MLGRYAMLRLSRAAATSDSAAEIRTMRTLAYAITGLSASLVLFGVAVLAWAVIELANIKTVDCGKMDMRTCAAYAIKQAEGR